MPPLSEEFIVGAVSTEVKDGAVKPWRVKYADRLLFPSDENETLLERMGFASGVRLRFKTGAPSVSLSVSPSDAARRFDLVNGKNALLNTFQLPPGEKIVNFNLKDEKFGPFEIWLPQDAPVSIAGIQAGGGTDIKPARDDKRARWTAYGSSITQCAAAHSPSRTWPGTAARRHNLSLTCLGYGGQCHSEPMAARMIRDIPADIITLKIGINIYGASSLSARTFKPAVIGLVEIIREKHPKTPIGLISPIISPSRESTLNSAGFTLEMMREELIDAAERLRRASGDDRLFYFDGRELFGRELADSYLPDGLHPDGDGYELLGKNAAEKVLPVLLEKVKS